jgi:ribosome-binding ATPase YchF (GTP1/OBG family)
VIARRKRSNSRNRFLPAGELRIEGKEYVPQDGDVIEFRFHV